MSKVRLLWDPKGFELDSLGQKKFDRITDGDTPYVSISIRMLSVDTPETHYPGTANPAKHDAKLKELADWLNDRTAPVEQGLADYLHPKLDTGNAGTLQKQQGDKATEEFKKLLNQKLTKDDGNKKRNLFLWTADEHFDQYGRLLAYVAPNYTRKERESIPYEDQATFNLLMIKSGWGASFPIYPSLPKYKDLVLMQKVAEDAYENKKGAWYDSNALTGYEFRMCYRLWEVAKKLKEGEKLTSREKYRWIDRYCFDMSSLEIYQPQEYYKVKPYNRIFIWSTDVHTAVGRLNLTLAG